MVWRGREVSWDRTGLMLRALLFHLHILGMRRGPGAREYAL